MKYLTLIILFLSFNIFGNNYDIGDIVYGVGCYEITVKRSIFGDTTKQKISIDKYLVISLNKDGSPNVREYWNLIGKLHISNNLKDTLSKALSIKCNDEK